MPPEKSQCLWNVSFENNLGWAAQLFSGEKSCESYKEADGREARR